MAGDEALAGRPPGSKQTTPLLVGSLDIEELRTPAMGRVIIKFTSRLPNTHDDTLQAIVQDPRGDPSPRAAS